MQLSKFKSTQYKDKQPTNLLCVNALIVPAKKNKKIEIIKKFKKYNFLIFI